MLNIAVCMSGMREAKGLEEQVRLCLQGRPGLAAHSTLYATGGELLNVCAAQDIILMDLSLPDMDGLEAAQTLRERNRQVALIVLAGSKKHAYDAYRLRAVQYLLKPVEQAELEEALEEAILLTGRRAEERFALNTTKGICWLPLSQIVCFKSDRHLVHVVMKDGVQHTSRSLRISFSSLVSSLLKSGRFVRPHHSYAVNLDYIERLTQDNLILWDESTVPVSRSKFTAMKDLLHCGQAEEAQF